MQTYKWNFNGIKVKPVEDNLKDVVVSYEWRRGLLDGDNYVDVYGSLSLTNPDPENFTDFEDLTEEDFVTWTIASLTQEKVDEYDLSLANQMENIKNPPLVNKTPPWIVNDRR